ncbi:MAG: thymidine phosphorylase [Robiginitomaculum sp.]|nr:MAG: thymidine phosphorylase [Robiginitomaculum sp.]
MGHSFLVQEFIRKIRDGETPSSTDIQNFVTGIADTSVSDAQVAAFTMAVFFNPLPMPQRVALTKAMRDSGDVLDWADIDGPILDKHSTGGVGDNVSLLLAPAVAACGGYVPMISGQGLGHTGGTLDKFCSIPGYTIFPDTALFKQTVKDVGCAIIGQTGALAPVDKKIYAIRSATATVESVSLITASILSKKLAAGLEGLVLDIKFGNGAFMQNYQQAKDLALSLVEVANGAGVKTTGLITDMNQPLASEAGNVVEMKGAIDHLVGTHRNPRLHEVVVELSADMLMHGGLAQSREEARQKIETVFTNGKAAEVFAKMVAALGGPSDILEHANQHLQSAPLIKDIVAKQDGIVSKIDTREIGLAVIVLGGGRKRPDDTVDYTVGFDRLVPLGTKVSKGDPIARIHAQSADALQEAGNMVGNAYVIGGVFEKTPLILELVTEG